MTDTHDETEHRGKGAHRAIGRMLVAVIAVVALTGVSPALLEHTAAAATVRSIPAQWSGNGNPSSSCGHWYQAKPPGPNYVGALKLSGGGGGVGNDALLPPYEFNLPTGGSGGLVGTSVDNAGQLVSVEIGCGGSNISTGTSAGFGDGAGGGRAHGGTGYDGGAGGGASALCVGSVSSDAGCTSPAVVAAGGGGSGAASGCDGDGWSGNGGNGGIEPFSGPLSNGWDVAGGKGGTDGFGVLPPPNRPDAVRGSNGNGGGGGSSGSGGSGGSGPASDGSSGQDQAFPSPSAGGSGGDGGNAASSTGGGGGGGGYTGGGGGGGDYCNFASWASGGGGGGGASGVDTYYDAGSSFTGGANGAIQESTNSCSTGGDTQSGGCVGYVSLTWMPAAAVRPTITSLNPSSGIQPGGYDMEISGSNLAPVSSVLFGTVRATVVSDTPNQLVVKVPAEVPAQYGSSSIAVFVITPGGSAVKNFTYTSGPGAPTITSFTPGGGPLAGQNSVIITGTNLAGATQVTMGGTDSMGITSNTGSQITAKAPPESAGSYEITVTTPLGGTYTGQYIYAGAPQVTTASLPAAQLGNPYQTTLKALYGLAPLSWSVVGGTLPAGLTLNAATGVISGTPQSVASETLRFQVVDAANQSDVSTPITLTVSPAATVTNASVAPTSSTYGSSVTYAATVTSAGGTPSGSVAFAIGSISLCRATLSSGAGSCTSGAAPEGGSGKVIATYSGATGFSPSQTTTSGPTVSLGVSAVTPSAPSSAFYGTTVAYSATVSAPDAASGAALPSGKVTFTSGSVTLCTATVDAGGANCRGITPSAGAASVVSAAYSGDSNYGGSTGQTTMTVIPATASVASRLSTPQSSYGQAVTYSAVVSSAVGAPTGSVTFVTGAGLSICTATLSSSAVDTSTGSCRSPSAGPVGPLTIFANYSGDTNFDPTNYTTQSASYLTVSPGVPTLAVGASPILSVFGGQQTYTARFLRTGPVAPSGTVTFSVAGNILCVAQATNDQASCTTSDAPGGIGYTVQAVYSGDQEYSGVYGSTVVSVFAAPTSTTPSSVPPASSYGQSVTYSAKVASGAGTPGGAVSFAIGLTNLCTATLSQGVASCDSVAAPVGIGETVTAAFVGSADYAASSGTTDLTVSRASSTLTVGATPNPVDWNGAVTYSATVTGRYSGTPSGTVQFSIGGSELCSGSISLFSRIATCTSRSAPGGTDTVTASYDGDGHFLGSSQTTQLTVVPANSTTQVTVAPTTVTYGDPVDYKASVSGPAGPAESGVVQFTDGTDVLCSANTGGGIASCRSDQALVGLGQTITAVFAGTNELAASVGKATLNVTRAITTAIPRAAPRTVAVGSPVTYSVTVTSSTGGTPGGSVAFTIGRAPLCTAILKGAVGSCRSTAARAGLDQRVTAAYSGDEVYPGTQATTTLNVTTATSRCSGSSTGAPGFSSGYWIANAAGAVYSCGDAPFKGSLATMGITPVQPIVGMAATPDKHGYWLVASDGGVFAFGDAHFYGSMGGHPLNKPIVGIAATPQGGYYEVASDGGIFSFGPGAKFYGSMGGQPLNQPVVGLASAPGGGYWEVASDGGIFSFGPGAKFHGSMGGTPLNKPVVGLASAPGGGYWEVASDGGIFSFGPGAKFYGSMGGTPLNQPVVGMASAPSGGYWEVASDGGVFSFGNAGFAGSVGGQGVLGVGALAEG